MIKKAVGTIVLFAAATAMFPIGASLFASEADDKIVSSFKESYVYRTYLKEDSIKAEAKDGVVTLTGTVADESHKTMAHEAAAWLTGVTSVANKLETEADVATESSDKWIGRKVKLALLLHRHVSGLNTTVDVQDGIVTLNGDASSNAQKELAAQYAGDIDGVTAVRNKMTVVEAKEPIERTAGEKIDDASVVAQVKTALLTHRSTKGLQTKVEARDGVVTLTGIAKNAAEKALVTKLVGDIQGVDSVKNEMTIQEIQTK